MSESIWDDPNFRNAVGGLGWLVAGSVVVAAAMLPQLAVTQKYPIEMPAEAHVIPRVKPGEVRIEVPRGIDPHQVDCGGTENGLGGNRHPNARQITFQHAGALVVCKISEDYPIKTKSATAK